MARKQAKGGNQEKPQDKWFAVPFRRLGMATEKYVAEFPDIPGHVIEAAVTDACLKRSAGKEKVELEFEVDGCLSTYYNRMNESKGRQENYNQFCEKVETYAKAWVRIQLSHQFVGQRTTRTELHARAIAMIEALRRGASGAVITSFIKGDTKHKYGDLIEKAVKELVDEKFVTKVVDWFLTEAVGRR